MKKIAIVTINQPSLDSASRLCAYLEDYEVSVFSKKGLKYDRDNLNIFNKLDDILDSAWSNFDAIIFILATGAVVRKIAPLLKDKTTDPAVLIINLDLTRVLPLLSGHLGGANELANYLSCYIPNCINFITTATDQTSSLAFDIFAKEEGFKIENIKLLAPISNALINKKEVKVCTYDSIFEKIKLYKNIVLVDNCKDELCVNITPFDSPNLTLKPDLFLGIGCNRGVSRDSIEKAVEWFLEKHNLKFSQIKNIGSFEAKKDEDALIYFASKYNFDIQFFDKDQINKLEHSFSTSEAKKFFGLKGVAEPSAILISKYRELIIKKEVYNREITIAGAV